jgi:hypothetical protein
VTDWSKVLEVILSGVIGVYVVMFLLQILTQFSTKIIDRIESWNKGAEQEPKPQPEIAVAKE